jgi:hypothetical protein
MAHYVVSASTLTVTQNITIPAGWIGQPVTLRALVKLVGTGFVIPFVNDNAPVLSYRINAGTGWQVVSETIYPTASGTTAWGISLNGSSAGSELFIDEFCVAAGTKALINPGKFGSFELNQKTHTSDSAAPTTGTWKLGDIVYNTSPASAGYVGWVCTAAGTPGTWKTFGLIS